MQPSLLRSLDVPLGRQPISLAVTRALIMKECHSLGELALARIRAGNRVAGVLGVFAGLRMSVSEVTRRQIVVRDEAR